MKGIAIAAVALVAFSGAAAAQPTELGGKVRSGPEVVVPAGETVSGDLIVSGGSIQVNGRVEGDLVAAGSEVTVAGTVTGDVLSGAGDTTISGTVEGDVRVGAGRARIDGRVGEDVLLGAGQATVAQGATIGGDLIFGAGQMSLDGAVAGSVLGATGDYARTGTIGGSEQVEVRQPEEQREPTVADRVLDGLRRYVSILVVGVLLLLLVPRTLRTAADGVRHRPLVSLGVGVVGFILTGILILLILVLTVLVAIVLGLLSLGPLAAATAIGGTLAAGVVGFAFFLALAFAAQAAVGFTIARLPFSGAPRPSFARGLAALAVGVLLVVLISSIPVAGGWLEALLVLFGLGGLLLALRPRRDRVPPATTG